MALAPLWLQLEPQVVQEPRRLAHLVVWQQHIDPRLPTNRFGVVRRMPTPLRRCRCLGSHFLGLDIGSCLRLDHENVGGRLRHKIRDVLRLLGAQQSCSKSTLRSRARPNISGAALIARISLSNDSDCGGRSERRPATWLNTRAVMLPLLQKGRLDSIQLGRVLAKPHLDQNGCKWALYWHTMPHHDPVRLHRDHARHSRSGRWS